MRCRLEQLVGPGRKVCVLEETGRAVEDDRAGFFNRLRQHADSVHADIEHRGITGDLLHRIFNPFVVLPDSDPFRYDDMVTVPGKNFFCLSDLRFVVELGNQLGGGFPDVIPGCDQKDIGDNTNHNHLIGNAVCKHVPGNIDRVIHLRPAQHHADGTGSPGEDF